MAELESQRRKLPGCGMISQGDKLTALVFDEPSLTTALPECRLVIAAAVAAGFAMAAPEDHPWLDYITGPSSLDEFKDAATPKRRVIKVCFDARVKVTLCGRLFTIHEFRKCFEALEWVKANPEHPIAYLRAFAARLAGLSADLKKMKPMFHLHRADRDVFIPQDAPPEKVHQLLWWFQHGVQSTPPPLSQAA